MARCDFAKWAPDGATPGGVIVPRVVILHCTAVDFDAHPHNGLEWHFEIDFVGRIDQLVDTERRADANYHANPFAISVETWGEGEDPLTDAQIASFIKLCRWANTTHGIPLRRCDKWNGSGIGHHTMWGAPGPWTPVAKSCPGPKRKVQFDTIILPALQSPADDDNEDDMEAAFIQSMHEMYYGIQPGNIKWDQAMVKSCNYWLDRMLSGVSKQDVRKAFAKTVGV